MHLTDEQLHEYLDRALAPEVRGEVVRHLAACADCTNRLAALQAAFAAIESLPDVAPERDLAGAVVRALQPASSGRAALPRWIRLTAGLQAAGAALALVFAAPILNQFAQPWVRDTGLPSLSTLLPELQAQWSAWVQASESFAFPSITMPVLDISSLAMTSAAVVAFLLWVVGNGLLLRRGILGRNTS